jgi:hypothetical protein
MVMKDIARKIAHLPEGLAEKNIQSWQHVVFQYESIVEYNKTVNQGFLPVLELARKISKSEQAKLFRAGMSLYSLLISTAEKHGLTDKEPFVSVFIERNASPNIGYWSNETKITEKPLNPEDDWLFVLQPFLDRLWNETRGKESP